LPPEKDVVITDRSAGGSKKRSFPGAENENCRIDLDSAACTVDDRVMYACSEYSFLNPVYVTHIIYSGNEDASRILYAMAKTCTYNVFRQAGAYAFGDYF
jgi:hypothetical protein